MKMWLMRVTKDLLRKKLRSLPCGGSHSHESRYSCSGCEPIYALLYPQGWSHYPGDVCEHGMYTGGCGIDYMCGPCEDGYEHTPSHKYVVRMLWRAILATGGGLSNKEYDALYQDTISKIGVIAGWQVSQQFDRDADGSLSFLFEALTTIDWVPEALFNRIEVVISEACEVADV